VLERTAFEKKGSPWREFPSRSRREEGRKASIYLYTTSLLPLGIQNALRKERGHKETDRWDQKGGRAGGEFSLAAATGRGGISSHIYLTYPSKTPKARLQWKKKKPSGRLKRR